MLVARFMGAKGNDPQLNRSISVKATAKQKAHWREIPHFVVVGQECNSDPCTMADAIAGLQWELGYYCGHSGRPAHPSQDGLSILTTEDRIIARIVPLHTVMDLS